MRSREKLLRALLSVKLAVRARKIEIVGVGYFLISRTAGFRGDLTEAYGLSLHELRGFLDIQPRELDNRAAGSRAF